MDSGDGVDVRRAGRRRKEDGFAGFSARDGVPVPPELFDLLLPRLTNLELRAFLYLIPHLRRPGREAVEIPLKELAGRVTAPPGGRDPGLSRNSFLRACGGLVRKGILLTEGPLFDPRCDDIGSCRLRLRPKQEAVAPVNADLPRRDARGPAGPTPLFLIQDLTQLGLSRRQARELVEECSEQEIVLQMLVLPLRASPSPVDTLLRSTHEAWPAPPSAASLLAVQPDGDATHGEAHARLDAHLGNAPPLQRLALMKQAGERIRLLGGPHFTDARIPHRLRLAFARSLAAEGLGIALPVT